jgi:Zn-dependent protease with chaperone function
VRGQFLATMITLASAAFGVVAALAWNAFITELVKAYLPAQAGLVGLLVYAIVITVIAVLVLMWLGRMAERTGGKSAV